MEQQLHITSIPELLAKLDSTVPSRSRVIAIDGRGGAGKSTLARTLAAEIPAAVAIEHDWFHLPLAEATHERRFDLDRLLRELIEPFERGERSFRFPRYNWGYLAGKEDGFDPVLVEIPYAEILVIEGCQTLSASLCPHYWLKIWVDTDPAESLRRGVRRDIEEYKLEPARVTEAWREWSAWEAQALHRDDRRARADIVFRSPQ